MDIGGTKIAGGIVNAEGALLRRAAVPTEAAQGSEQIIANALRLSKDLLDSHRQVSRIPVLALGVGSVGQIDYASGRVVFATSTLPGWAGTCLKSTLSAELGLSTFVENDANAAAYGEYRAGAARGYRHVVCLTLGTGIGGGVIADGQLLRGATGGAAELGHVAVEMNGDPCPCGRRGCLEAYSSGSALLRNAKNRLDSLPKGTRSVLSGQPTLTGPVIFEAAASGDSLAQDVVERYCRYLAKGLTLLSICFRSGKLRAWRRRVRGRGAAVGRHPVVPCRNRIAIFDCCWRRSETMRVSSAQRCSPETVLSESHIRRDSSGRVKELSRRVIHRLGRVGEELNIHQACRTASTVLRS